MVFPCLTKQCLGNHQNFINWSTPGGNITSKRVKNNVFYCLKNPNSHENMQLNARDPRKMLTMLYLNINTDLNMQNGYGPLVACNFLDTLNTSLIYLWRKAICIIFSVITSSSWSFSIAYNTSTFEHVYSEMKHIYQAHGIKLYVLRTYLIDTRLVTEGRNCWAIELSSSLLNILGGNGCKLGLSGIFNTTHMT